MCQNHEYFHTKKKKRKEKIFGTNEQKGYVYPENLRSYANPPLRSLDDATCSVLYIVHHLWNTPFTTKKGVGEGTANQRAFSVPTHFISTAPGVLTRTTKHPAMSQNHSFERRNTTVYFYVFKFYMI